MKKKYKKELKHALSIYDFKTTSWKNYIQKLKRKVSWRGRVPKVNK